MDHFYVIALTFFLVMLALDIVLHRHARTSVKQREILYAAR